MGEGERGDLPLKKIQSDAAATAAGGQGSGSAAAAAAAASSSSSDVPAKKLARQLDFTGFGGASGSVVLPEHPQSQTVLPAQPVTPPVTPPLQQAAVQSQPQPPVVAIPVAPQPSSIPSSRMV